MISNRILATTLKNLHNRRDNFYSSVENHPGDTRAEHWHEEIENLNEAIAYFEQEREKNRLNGERVAS